MSLTTTWTREHVYTWTREHVNTTDDTHWRDWRHRHIRTSLLPVASPSDGLSASTQRARCCPGTIPYSVWAFRSPQVSPPPGHAYSTYLCLCVSCIYMFIYIHVCICVTNTVQTRYKHGTNTVQTRLSLSLSPALVYTQQCCMCVCVIPRGAWRCLEVPRLLHYLQDSAPVCVTVPWLRQEDLFVLQCPLMACFRHCLWFIGWFTL